MIPDPATVARVGGPTTVLEWLDTHDGVVRLATFIDRDGCVTTSDLGDPGLDLDVLAEKIAFRASNWHEGRVGEPFDLPAWHQFIAWLHHTLEGRLPEGGQLVVIEHPEVWGLQWHAAAAPKWRTSYVSGWTALLQARESAPQEQRGSIGIAMVAKFRDSVLVTGPLEQSANHARALAARTGRAADMRAAEVCDRAALIELFESSDVAKVLCHGYVDPADRQVALAVAADGELPLADSAAAGTPAGARHRFGWQDCQTLAHAPRVVFSAACSSGLAHPAGLGERLGFYRVLGRAGTRSMIAPRWDIKPAAVLPILDDTMTRHLENCEPLGEALHNACLQAAATQPNWIAWALALEGDWK